MFKKLRNRFLWYTMGLLTLVFISLFFSIYVSTENSARQQIDISLQMVMEKQEHRKLSNPLVAAAISLRLDEETNEAEWVSSLIEVDEDALKTAVAEILKSGVSKGFVSMGGVRYAYIYWPGSDHNNVALVSSAQYDQTMNSLLLTFLITGAGALGLLFLLSLLFSEKAIKPVRQAFEKQKQFIADASHELKTPLTIIGANLDLIASNNNETVASQHKWLSYIRDQAVRMSRLVNDMLNLAKLDDSSHMLAPTQTDISALLKRSLLYYEAPYYEKNIAVTAEIAECVQIKADEPTMERLAGILLDNALKYTPQGGKVRILLMQDKTKMRLSISNTYENLEQDNVNRLFDRFYRVSSSRSQQNAGYGLGLAIAKSIVEQDGGKISVHLTDEEIEFRVELQMK